MGKRLNKKTRFAVTVDLSQVDGFTSGELVLNLELNHPKVLTTPLGTYAKRVVVDLRPYLVTTEETNS